MKFTTFLIAGIAAFALAGCSSAPRATASATPSSLFATGPIYSACQQAGRKQATRARCGCVQAVADQSLSSGDQRRGSGFFRDPHQAQVVRQSDRDIDERFWKRWRAYTDTAARICT